MPKANKTKKQNTLEDRVTNVKADILDLRDLIYRPTLLDLKLSLSPPSPSISPILDQGVEGACTGFALASAINLQNNLRQSSINSRDVFTKIPFRVSPRMLYEMAKIHDEWPGEEYAGSSIRGALKGFFQCGVCDSELAPYTPGEENWILSVEQAKNARIVGLGAYYRLQPRINDYHAALNETGVIFVSANVHEGWSSPEDGIIKKSDKGIGGHAFIIVGYDQLGFLVQNSWGNDWGSFAGHNGIARWSYDDWAENVMDAWVLRLAVPTPEFFDLTFRPKTSSMAAGFSVGTVDAPRYKEIAGHFIHLDDGKLVENGNYPTTQSSIEQTAELLTLDGNDENSKYNHLLFYMHGGLNKSSDSAKRIVQMKNKLKKNGIYPMHFMWETGFSEELKDVLLGLVKKTESRVGSGQMLSDMSDWVIEKVSRLPGRAIWREMKRDAKRSFSSSGAGGTKAVKILLEANSARKTPMKVHFVGHSAGSILLARLLLAKSSIDPNLHIESVSLMAPACTMKLFKNAYAPMIGAHGGIKSLIQYNLSDELERADSVGPYQKSLLYLVSNAFEILSKGQKAKPLLGMENYSKDIKLNDAHKLFYTEPGSDISRSISHGGFDNDAFTMNDILKTILGKYPEKGFAFEDNDLH